MGKRSQPSPKLDEIRADTHANDKIHLFASKTLYKAMYSSIAFLFVRFAIFEGLYNSGCEEGA